MCRVGLCAATYFIGNFINRLMHEKSPFFVILFPLLGAVFLTALLPIATYATYPADFPGKNLLIPKHFFHIAKKTWGSLSQNNGKVKAKDL